MDVAFGSEALADVTTSVSDLQVLSLDKKMELLQSSETMKLLGI